MDINPFAVEVAKVTLMLGRLLASAELGEEQSSLPLDDMDANIVEGDAIFHSWPPFDACIGNPPYLGRRKIVSERGAGYSNRLRRAFPDVGDVSDYVVYWFRLAHDRLPPGGRAGLVATNSIRETSSRVASLDYVVDNGGTITEAWSSLNWSGDAVVHVSVVNWIKGEQAGDKALWLDEGERRVDLPMIPTSLSESLDLRQADDLEANAKPKVFFQGQTPGNAAFVVETADANKLRDADRGSAAVIRPFIVGDDLLHLGRPARWIIDIGDLDVNQAKSSAPAAFDYLRRTVLPQRSAQAKREEEGNRAAILDDPSARVNWHHRNFLRNWWRLSYRRDDLLDALRPLKRYLTVSRVASEARPPVFVFVKSSVRPSDAIQAFAFEDDYSFGVLQSSLHERWFRGRCSTLKSDLRYTSKTVFNSFPWPQSPSVAAVAGVAGAAEAIQTERHQLSQRGLTLAQQYAAFKLPGANRLRDLHAELDKRVVAAFGFDRRRDLLLQLLELNQVLAGEEAQGKSVRGPGCTGLVRHISAHAVS
jgi:hypothetical protein